MAEGEYVAALGIHEAVLRYLVERDPVTSGWFSDEVYGPLLMEALDHAVDLFQSCRYPAMLELVGVLMPRFADSAGGEGYLDGLETMRGVATERILYTRSSSRSLDAVVYCVAGDDAALATPLIAALQELGVSVEPSPFISSSFEVSFDDRLERCDFMILLVSPDLCANRAILGAVEPLLDGSSASRGRVIPVWGDVARADVAGASAPLRACSPSIRTGETSNLLLKMLPISYVPIWRAAC